MTPSSGSGSGGQDKRRRKSRRFGAQSRKVPAKDLKTTPHVMSSFVTDAVSAKSGRKKPKSSNVPPARESSGKAQKRSKKKDRGKEAADGREEKPQKDDENEPTVFEEITTPLRPATEKHGSSCKHTHSHTKRGMRKAADEDRARMMPPQEDFKTVEQQEVTKVIEEAPEPAAGKTMSKFLQMQLKLRARQKAKEAALKKQSKKDDVRSPIKGKRGVVKVESPPAHMPPNAVPGTDDSTSSGTGSGRASSMVSSGSPMPSLPSPSPSMKHRRNVKRSTKPSIASSSTSSVPGTSTNSFPDTNTVSTRSSTSMTSSIMDHSVVSGIDPIDGTNLSGAIAELKMSPPKKKDRLEELSCETTNANAHQFSGLPVLTDHRILAKALRKKNGRSHRDPALQILYGRQPNSECQALTENPRAVAASRLKPTLRKKIVVKPLPADMKIPSTIK
ncbi:hypothetical protein L596_015985 [Steinernema carpocapsae]|uniref:Uncharacterized protein n=1 Tax=Steinernema carpocapsae TaxID=34508 RepID=A0A4U5NHL2_STECR|nr:hypothetical protein L596_015985 [Steinernema carpocapsae]